VFSTKKNTNPIFLRAGVFSFREAIKKVISSMVKKRTFRIERRVF
jgi:hypothetical protein